MDYIWPIVYLLLIVLAYVRGRVDELKRIQSILDEARKG